MYTRIEAGIGRSYSGLGIIVTSILGSRRLRMVDTVYVLSALFDGVLTDKADFRYTFFG